MIDEWLTKLINFIFPYQKDFDGNEKLYWDKYWSKMIDYYKNYGEIFEIRDKWDFYCNEALHSHYKSIIKEILNKDFKNLKCIECGCGGGYESALMARDGAEVTVLDYSEKAIEYAKIVNQRMDILNKIKFVKSDIFDFCINEKHDLVWNCGLIEHYQDNEIVQMIKKMMDLAKNNGLIVITIPNLLSPQSIYWMLATGKSSEKYISHRKLKTLMKRSGLKYVEIKNFHYWLPSCLPAEWAVKISKNKLLNNLKILCWLFSGIGLKI